MIGLFMKYFIFPKFGLGIGNGLETVKLWHCRLKAMFRIFTLQLSTAPSFQFPEYSNLVGWSSHHEPEEIQTSGYLSGCYHGYHQSTINQSSTGTGQPATAINNGGFQELRK